MNLKKADAIQALLDEALSEDVKRAADAKHRLALKEADPLILDKWGNPEIPEFLYHGTSGKIAKAILKEGCIRPGATEPMADPNMVYLMHGFVQPLLYAYLRVMGSNFHNPTGPEIHTFVKGKKYDEVAVLWIETKSLDKSLFRKGLGLYQEWLYQGSVPGSAITHVARAYMSQKLEDVVSLISRKDKKLLEIGNPFEHLGVRIQKLNAISYPFEKVVI